VVFPQTSKRLEWLVSGGAQKGAATWRAYDTNVNNLIRVGAHLMLGNDGMLLPPEIATDPMISKSWQAPGEDNVNDLGKGHFVWFKAMEEKGCDAMTMLKAATRNIAVAYGKDRDLGSIEVGKIADVILLDEDPLASWRNYQSIHAIIKDGVRVERDSLPTRAILTKPWESAEEEACYIPAGGESGSFPGCPVCSIQQ
jgi:hypothetical protein